MNKFWYGYVLLASVYILGYGGNCMQWPMLESNNCLASLLFIAVIKCYSFKIILILV